MNKHHPVYEPKKWNSNVNIKQSHNCYAYALNTIHAKQSIKCRKYMNATKKIHCISNKPQVGRYSRIADPKLYTCKNIEYRMLNDNPTIRKLKKNEECPDGFYKIALTCSKSDYHFYRQDNTGLWSHKDGWRLATNKDLKGRLIHDPELADRGKYTVYCGEYAVPNLNKKMSS